MRKTNENNENKSSAKNCGKTSEKNVKNCGGRTSGKKNTKDCK